MLTQEWDMGKALDTRFMEGMGREKLETALRMLSDGATPDMISKYTGLPLEKIKSLKQ